MWGGLGFQDITSIKNSFINTLHDLIMVWLTVILVVVLILIILVRKNSYLWGKRTHSLKLEVLWTVLPIIILLTIGGPRVFLLCSQDYNNFKEETIERLKLVRNQWNWQRESNSTQPVEHLLDTARLDLLRRFDSPVLIRHRFPTRILLTRRDVLHSLGVPRLGLKLDSTPGRLNVVLFEAKTLGILNGSCYELCGRGHRAMPIFFKAC
jgi:cytochrome c oxidase subunit 2